MKPASLAECDLDPARPQPMGRALAAIPPVVYETIDRAEPEWTVLKRLIPLGPVGLLVGIGLALTDFQLGTGGATRYWMEADTLLSERTVQTNDDLRVMMDRLVQRPVAARLQPLKLHRIEKLLRSNVPDLIRASGFEGLGQNPMAFWGAIAAAMRQRLEDKTVVFAMKICDLMQRIATGRYLVIPADVPIVADLRIARISLSSGLLRPRHGGVTEAMALVTTSRGVQPDQVRKVWGMVAMHTHGVSLFRIDSLVWQFAEPIYQLRERPVEVRAATMARLTQHGAAPDVAERVVREMTHGLR